MPSSFKYFNTSSINIVAREINYKNLISLSNCQLLSIYQGLTIDQFQKETCGVHYNVFFLT